MDCREPVDESFWWEEEKKRERGGSPKRGGRGLRGLKKPRWRALPIGTHTTEGQRPTVSLTDLDS